MEKYDFKPNQDIVDEIIEELSESPNLKRFFIDHDISHDTIENHLNDLMTYKSEYPRCLDCQGLEHCTQDTLGHQPVLNYIRNTIQLSYQPCNFLRHHTQQQTISNRVQALHMPKMIMDARLDDFHMKTDNRKDLYKKIMLMMQKMKLGEQTKGFYLTGRYQIGKTYTLAAIANHFATLGKTVIIGYFPDMVREIKSTISTGGLEPTIDKLKNVDVLILDDIGGEAPSQWLRDEVLGPILQHRLLDQKLTCFSSNIPLKELGKSMAQNDQKAENIKAFRIIERIKALADEIVM